jgi:hypothetical protein
MANLKFHPMPGRMNIVLIPDYHVCQRYAYLLGKVNNQQAKQARCKKVCELCSRTPRYRNDHDNVYRNASANYPVPATSDNARLASNHLRLTLPWPHGLGYALDRAEYEVTLLNIIHT